MSYFNELPPISREIWATKYRLNDEAGDAVDHSIEETWSRVAKAVARAEAKGERKRWAGAFRDAMADFKFIPAGRVLAGAGTKRDVTLFNCFVMGEIEDDMQSIFDNVSEAGLTMQRGGGIGHDFSTLRPRGAYVKGVGAEASGPVHFMDIWDSMCRTIMSAGSRRGAMMGTMRCDHPDIEEFIDVKSDPQRLRNFNLSVLVTDAFMTAVERDDDWPLVFAGKTWRTVRARGLWERIMRATYDYAEPGVIFIDRINQQNNLSYCETIRATNPCGEQPLPPYGACLLGSINLARLIKHPFSVKASDGAHGESGKWGGGLQHKGACLDEAALRALVPVAVRFLDNVIDVSSYPLKAQRKEARAKRRIGLGVTGLADALVMCGLRYGSAEAVRWASDVMKLIRDCAYEASADLAKEKGAFALFKAKPFLARPNVVDLPGRVRRKIKAHGIRNGLLTSIAPTGTISLFAGNVSSGIEPIFDASYERSVLQPDGTRASQSVRDYAVAQYQSVMGKNALPPALRTVSDLDPADHIAMQAGVQRYVDSAISKTVNCPEDISFDAFQSIYRDAYQAGLKGCTTYRPNAVTGSVLRELGDDEPVDAAGGPDAVDNRGGPNTLDAPEGATEATAVNVSKDRISADNAGSGSDVIYISRPLERDDSLSGKTYKLRWPSSEHALYITVNDIEADGKRRPFEVFINSKNMEHYAWTVALTRMISAVFRRGGDVAFVVDELQEIFDPRGGHWMNQRYVPSLIAAIGGVIEQHLVDIGFVSPDRRALPAAEVASSEGVEFGEGDIAEARVGLAGKARIKAATPSDHQTQGALSRKGAMATLCPKCHQPRMVQIEGCLVCRSCGFSKCG